ncbi:MAG: penicillin-binding protein activator, partial [Gammaproteobacteria bacterium]
LGLTARRNLLDTTALAAATDAWQQTYPGHPAAALVESLLERSEALGVRPRSIALLLPFEATLRPAAQAVRDGFLTAWFGDGDLGSRPAVRVYSTADAELATLVDQAHADGAEFIVGPLRKDLVAELRADSDLAVGVLALNVVDAPGLARPGFYQFGLTPEDEAAQVAEHAARRGSRALLLVPDSTWGERLGQAYEAAWSAVGGTVLSRVDYSENTEGYARAVREALAIDASKARAVALREHLDLPLHYEPRRRADAELILLAAFPGNARQLMPQLRYFGAGAMPVFATSHVYGGTRDAEGDVDLDGIEFGDMPWLFGAADPATRATVERHWQPAAATMARLYAFGIDAYRVLPYLAKLRLQPALRVPGVTGELTMDRQGVMHRKLTWLRFVGGVPRRVTDLSPVPPHDVLAHQ